MYQYFEGSENSFRTILSIDIGGKNTCMTVSTIEEDYIYVRSLFIGSVDGLNPESMANVFSTIKEWILLYKVTFCVVEKQLEAKNGRSNHQMLVNKYIEGAICGFVAAFGIDIYAYPAALRGQHLRAHYKGNKKGIKALSKAYVNDLDIVYDNLFSEYFDKQKKRDDIYDSIAQAVLYCYHK